MFKLKICRNIMLILLVLSVISLILSNGFLNRPQYNVQKSIVLFLIGVGVGIAIGIRICRRKKKDRDN